MRRVRGLTVLEAMIVVAVIAIVAALLTPVFSKAKQAAQRRGSAAKMRSLYLVLESYRNDYDGSNVSYEYYKLGLPSSAYFFTTQWYLPDSAWSSPCGPNVEIAQDTPANVSGWIFYGAAYADPRYFIAPNANPQYRDYLEQYRENSVMFGDPFCNPVGTKMKAPLVKKRTIAILLSGQIVDRERAGNAHSLHFYSDQPD